MPKEKVQEFLMHFHIEVAAHRTRRSLAAALDREGLLVGNVESYRSYFSAIDGIGDTSVLGDRSNVIVLDDFRGSRAH